MPRRERCQIVAQKAPRTGSAVGHPRRKPPKRHGLYCARCCRSRTSSRRLHRQQACQQAQKRKPRSRTNPDSGVLTIYLTDIVPSHSRPKETKGRIARLDAFFGDKMLSYVTGEICRTYAGRRSTDAAARRELEDLRAAINHHRREGLCNKVVEVVLHRSDHHGIDGSPGLRRRA